jgi:hypothetical protein
MQGKILKGHIIQRLQQPFVVLEAIKKEICHFTDFFWIYMWPLKQQWQ